MADKIQVRRGTASEWSASNPILSAGEIGLATDTNKFKVGDGIAAWNSLSYSIPPYTEVTSLDVSQYVNGELQVYLQVYGTTVGSYTALRIQKNPTSSWTNMVNLVDFIKDNYLSGGSGNAMGSYGAPEDPETTNYATISIGGKTTIVKVSYAPNTENGDTITISCSYVSGDLLIGSQDPDTGTLIYQTGQLSFSVEKKFKNHYVTNNFAKNSWKKANEVPVQFETKTYPNLQWLDPHKISYDSNEKALILEFIDPDKTFDSWLSQSINNEIPNWSDITIESKTGLFKSRVKKTGSAFILSPDSKKLFIPSDYFFGDPLTEKTNFNLKYEVDYASGDQRVLSMTWAGPSWVVNPAGPATSTTRGTVFGKTEGNSAALGFRAWETLKGSEIVAIGDYSLNKADWGASQSLAVGTRSLENLTNGNGNIAIGYYAARDLEEGGNNIVIGYNSQLPETIIYNQILIGNAQSNRLRIPGLGIDWTPETVPGGAASPTSRGAVFGRMDIDQYDSTTAIGKGAISSEFYGGGSGTAFGRDAMAASTTANNAAFGAYALASNTIGYQNTAIGNNSMQDSIQTQGNTALGYQAGRFMQGNFNVAVGSEALFYQSSQHTAAQNTAIGANAGNQLLSGSNNIIIGYNAQASSDSSSNTVTLGNSSITTLRCQVTSITALSDARDKKNIKSLDLGLDFINKLNPVKFDWNMRDGGKVDVPDTGFIAQELVEIEDESGIAEYLKLTFRENPDKLEASYGRLIPVLVKAIQDLSKEVDKLKGN